MNLTDYPTPLTSKLCDKLLLHFADTKKPTGDTIGNVLTVILLHTSDLERKLALCREALEWIANLYDDSKPTYQVAMDAYGMKSEAATALAATEPKP